MQADTKRNNWLLMALLAIGLAVCAAEAFKTSFNFDVWYMLATGREIVQSGIPYQNPFALQDGMQMIVQQWMLCVLLYGLYQAGGFVALALWTMALAIGLMVSLYRLGRLVKADRFGGEWLMALLLVATVACLSYITMCSSVYSMIAYCWVMFFCEKYRRTGQYRWLGALLPLAVLHAGFHLSLAAFDLVIIGCYAVPDVLAPLHKRGRLMGVRLDQGSYRRLPLLIALAGVAVALCINPYGIRGALYLFLSYGAAEYGGAVPEMRALAPSAAGLSGYAAVVMLLLAGLAVGRRGLRSINLPLVLLTAGTALLTFQHVRNVWLVTPFAYALAASTMHGWSLGFDARKRPASRATRRIAGAAAGLLCVVAVGVGAMLVYSETPAMADMEKTGKYSPTALVRAIEQDAGTTDVRLFNPVRLGAYLEWSGFKVWVDSRLEIWNSPISGADRDYYTEYVDMCNGDWYDVDFEAFLNENGFDYLITENNSQMEAYLQQTDGYTTLLGSGDYTLWKRAA